MIPFIDLETQQARIRSDLDNRLRNVLDHGHYIMGPEVDELEKKLCDFTGAPHCISCSSGSDGLLMALLAWGIGRGDAVFVPPFTFFATAEMPALLGATPVFVDIDPKSFLMLPDQLEKAIAKVIRDGKLRPAAVIPVDLFGQPALYDAILPIAKKYGLKTLEDAAQAFGGTRHGRHACNLGYDAAVTSFFPAKPLGCYGDGGAIFTDDEELAAILRSIRVHGKGRDKYDNERIGVNGRLDTMQAAVLLSKLEIFPDELDRRQAVAEMYTAELKKVPHIGLPHVVEGSTSAWAQYCITVPEENRSGIVAALKKRGIPTNIYYPKPLHMLGAFPGYAPEQFPNALGASQTILALPFHPYMERDTVKTIAEIIGDA